MKQLMSYSSMRWELRYYCSLHSHVDYLLLHLLMTLFHIYSSNILPMNWALLYSLPVLHHVLVMVRVIWGHVLNDFLTVHYQMMLHICQNKCINYSLFKISIFVNFFLQFFDVIWWKTICETIKKKEIPWSEIGWRTCCCGWNWLI